MRRLQTAYISEHDLIATWTHPYVLGLPGDSQVVGIVEVTLRTGTYFQITYLSRFKREEPESTTDGNTLHIKGIQVSEYSDMVVSSNHRAITVLCIDKDPDRVYAFIECSTR